MRKILITGVNGFLGSHLAQNLKSDFEVIGLVNTIKNIHRVKNLSIKIYSSQDSLENIFRENYFFAIVHTATKYKKKHNTIIPLIESNVILPIKLAELCSKYNVKAFLNTDSFFNDEKHSYSYLPQYTLSKKQSYEWMKLIALEGAFKLINMKIFHMYGENDSESKFIPFMISEIKRAPDCIEMTAGEQTRDFIYIDDVVSAYKKVLASMDNLKDYFIEFNIGTGKSTSIKDFAKLAKRLIGSKTNLIFGAIEYRQGEIMVSKANNESLCKLGWKAKYNLERGLIKYISE